MLQVEPSHSFSLSQVRVTMAAHALKHSSGRPTEWGPTRNLEAQLRGSYVPIRGRPDFAKPETNFTLRFSPLIPVPPKRWLGNRDSNCNKAKVLPGSQVP